MSAAEAAAGTVPVVPDCQVRDMIITWDEVQEGDLVLHDGELKLVEDKHAHFLYPGKLASVRLSGPAPGFEVALLDGLTAVRPHVTTEG